MNKEGFQRVYWMCGFNSSYSKLNLRTFWIWGVKTNSVMIPPVCLAGAFFFIFSMSLFKKPVYCCFWYQNRPKSLCGKNQFGHDSSGLPGRFSFFFGMSLFEKTGILLVWIILLLYDICVSVFVQIVYPKSRTAPSRFTLTR